MTSKLESLKIHLRGSYPDMLGMNTAVPINVPALIEKLDEIAKEHQGEITGLKSELSAWVVAVSNARQSADEFRARVDHGAERVKQLHADLEKAATAFEYQKGLNVKLKTDIKSEASQKAFLVNRAETAEKALMNTQRELQNTQRELQIVKASELELRSRIAARGADYMVNNRQRQKLADIKTILDQP